MPMINIGNEGIEDSEYQYNYNTVRIMLNYIFLDGVVIEMCPIT